MSRVLVLVEGKTERRFLNSHIKELMAEDGIDLNARLLGDGGNNYPQAKKQLQERLKEDRRRIVTMCFDYYGSKNQWPGKKEAAQFNKQSGGAAPKDLADIMIRAIGEDVLDGLPEHCHPRFLPYIQMHEFESLLFAHFQALIGVLQPRNNQEKELMRIVGRAADCECINNIPGFGPADCLEKYAGYAKSSDRNSHSLQILKDFSLDSVEKSCPLFHAWIKQIKDLAMSMSEGQD